MVHALRSLTHEVRGLVEHRQRWGCLIQAMEFPVRTVMYDLFENRSPHLLLGRIDIKYDNEHPSSLPYLIQFYLLRYQIHVLSHASLPEYVEL